MCSESDFERVTISTASGASRRRMSRTAWAEISRIGFRAASTSGLFADKMRSASSMPAHGSISESAVHTVSSLRYSSRHPLLPHEQASPDGSMDRCPTSNAVRLLSDTSFPFWINAPPTPARTKKRNSEETPRACPYRSSASATIDALLVTMTGTEKRLLKRSPKGNSFMPGIRA